jgi:hypothetical protein
LDGLEDGKNVIEHLWIWCLNRCHIVIIIHLAKCDQMALKLRLRRRVLS